MSKHAVHFSSKKQDWATPRAFFDKYNTRYDFRVDLACTRKDCLCPVGFYHDEGWNALEQNWAKKLGPFWGWLNPPYGRELKRWVKKAHDEAERGAKIVMLIPARTDTSYFHDYIYNNPLAVIQFIRGRLKFGQATNGAPFPSMIVIFNEEN